MNAQEPKRDIRCPHYRLRHTEALLIRSEKHITNLEHELTLLEEKIKMLEELLATNGIMVPCQPN